MNNESIIYHTQAIDPNILSVYDTIAAGKVVTSATWVSLWELVISRINALDSFCTNIEDIRLAWEHNKTVLDESLTAFDEKYNILSKSFVHYGKQAPADTHTKLWIEPVSELDAHLVVTQPDFKAALNTKINKAERIVDGVLNLDLTSAFDLINTNDYIIKRYYAEADITRIVVYKNNIVLVEETQFIVPAGTTITIVCTTRTVSNYNAAETLKHIIRTAITLDTPWIVTTNDTTYSSYGQFIITVPSADAINDEVTKQFYKTASIDLVKSALIILNKDAWNRQNAGEPYSQILSNLEHITNNSKIDLTPSPTQLVSFYEKGYMFIIANNNTEVTAYCIGNKPTEDILVPVTITEVFN